MPKAIKLQCLWILIMYVLKMLSKKIVGFKNKHKLTQKCQKNKTLYNVSAKWVGVGKASKY
jgi:hypothetical protein